MSGVGDRHSDIAGSLRTVRGLQAADSSRPTDPLFFLLLLTRVTFASSCSCVPRLGKLPAWLYSSLCHPAPLLETVRSTTTMMGSQLRNIPCNCKSPCISTLEGSRSRQNPFESFLHSLSVSAHCLLGCILQAV